MWSLRRAVLADIILPSNVETIDGKVVAIDRRFHFIILVVFQSSEGQINHGRPGAQFSGQFFGMFGIVSIIEILTNEQRQRKYLYI